MGMAQGKLGKLKDKVTGTTGTSDVSTGNKGEDKQIELSKKGEEAYDAKKYKEAADLFQQAHDACPDCSAAKRGDYISRKNSALEMLETEKSNANADSEAEKMLQNLNNNKYKCSEIPTDNGSSGDFHDANVGKIVFSKSEIVKGQEDASAMTNSFSTSDNIYSRVYMNHSIGYECANMGICYSDPYHSTAYRFVVDGGKYDLSKSYFDKGEMTFNSVDEELLQKWTTWQPAISPESKDGYGTSEMQFFYSMLEFLPAGKHTIKFEIVIDVPEDKKTDYETYDYTTKFGPEKVVASGEFTLDVKEADKAMIKTKTGSKSKAELDAENQKAFNSTMESSGVWLINKCSSSVKVTAGGNPVTIDGNGSTRISLKAGDSITNSSGTLLRHFSSDPPAGRRTDVIVCD